MAFLAALLSGSAAALAGADTERLAELLPETAALTQADEGQARQALVAPVALYPDALLAVVLAAAAFPDQVFEAAARVSDPDFEPDPLWDDAVVALLNYPGVLARMDEDREWTRRHGALVREDREGLLDAIAEYRDFSYLVGNLRSDGRLNVERVEGVLTIASADPDVMYVPRYEAWESTRPEPVTRTSRIVHYEHRPVYYFPYPVGYTPRSGRYWGVSTAYGLGWLRRELYVHPYWYRQHPFYGHRYYFDHHYYRFANERNWPPYTDLPQAPPVAALSPNYFSWHWLHRPVRPAAVTHPGFARLGNPAAPHAVPRVQVRPQPPGKRPQGNKRLIVPRSTVDAAEPGALAPRAQMRVPRGALDTSQSPRLQMMRPRASEPSSSASVRSPSKITTPSPGRSPRATPRAGRSAGSVQRGVRPRALNNRMR